jgi:hypothetical protein
VKFSAAPHRKVHVEAEEFQLEDNFQLNPPVNPPINLEQWKKWLQRTAGQFQMSTSNVE